MNVNDIKELITAVSNSKICDFEYEENGVKLSLSKGNGSAAGEIVERKVIIDQEYSAQVGGNDLQTPTATEGKVVTSPLVGTVYMAPAEGEAPYVSVGDRVRKGQILAIVEAMKLMNEIESEYDGVVKEICVDNETAVEFGQRLFVIE